MAVKHNIGLSIILISLLCTPARHNNVLMSLPILLRQRF